jgi:DNA (cytosine-5)-methyltransferase 3A
VAENVASMTFSDKQAILEHLQKVYPETYVINIDSKLVSASRRNRLYFTNIPGIEQPTDLGIKLSDLIENGYVSQTKSNAVLSSNVTLYKSGLERHLRKGLGTVIYRSKLYSELSTDDKLCIYLKLLEDSGYNGKPNKELSELSFPNEVFRLPTIKEYCRLMTFPDFYLDVPKLSKTSKVKLLGLSMTVDTIKHLFTYLPQ